MSKRDKFLTEAMGYKYDPQSCFGNYIPTFLDEIKLCDTLVKPINFSTWEGFGKLWEWAQKQEWWVRYYKRHIGRELEGYIHPTRFADAIYEYLKERKEYL